MGWLRRLIPWVLSFVLVGCSVWSSTPKRTIKDYGQSVSTMVTQSVANPSKSQTPALNAPDGMEGQKAVVLYQKGYQSDQGVPGRVRSPAQLGISSVNPGN
jgi:hypothetical protein